MVDSGTGIEVRAGSLVESAREQIAQSEERRDPIRCRQIKEELPIAPRIRHPDVEPRGQPHGVAHRLRPAPQPRLIIETPRAAANDKTPRRPREAEAWRNIVM